MIGEKLSMHCVLAEDVPLPEDSGSADLSSVDEELACLVSECLSIKACDFPPPPSSRPADDELLVMLGNIPLFPSSSSTDAEMDVGHSDLISFQEAKTVPPPPTEYYYSVFFLPEEVPLTEDLDDPMLSSLDEELACLMSECLHITACEFPPPPSHFGDIQDIKQPEFSSLDEELAWLMSKSLSI